MDHAARDHQGRALFERHELILNFHIPKSLAMPTDRISASKTSPSQTSFASPTSGSETAPSLAPTTLSDGGRVPQLLVFDLDYTLWPFWIDSHVSPPIRAADPSARAHALDRTGKKLSFYPEVPAVLAACAAAGLRVAAASRTHTPALARQLLDILRVRAQGAGPADGGARPAADFFAALEIFPGDKTAHMRKLRAATGVGYEEMLFFDDEVRNRNVERELGVAFVLVERGVSVAVVDEGIRAWRKRRGFVS